MKEFLIRCDDENFCVIHVNKLGEVSHPNSVESEQVEGWGDYRIKIGDSEISFSFEMVGIQISFETGKLSPEKAETIVSEISRNVERELKKSCSWVQISD